MEQEKEILNNLKELKDIIDAGRVNPLLIEKRIDYSLSIYAIVLSYKQMQMRINSLNEHIKELENIINLYKGIK